MKKINTHELYLAVLNDCNEKPERSAWGRGVQAYAVEIAETLADQTREVEPTRAAIEHIALNGARDWSQYSWGGCSLVYDEDIAKLLCPPSTLKRKRNGALPPNSREEWLDVQARALAQACRRVCRIAKALGAVA
nr:MAG TPA: hypothetical protein [Caudoviricetes sp.]